jgi:hypothetical protein
MVHRSPQSACDPLYDVLLTRAPPAPLRSRYPTMTVHPTCRQTALRGRVNEAGQLDQLLEMLRSFGLRLLEVHRASGGDGPAGTYEVRVQGELGAPLLRYLRWPHRVVPQQTRVRIAAAADELHEFLRECHEGGASIECVHRVDPVRERERAFS